MKSIQLELTTPFAPRFDRCKSSTKTVSLLKIVYKEMNLPVDSHGTKGRMRKLFAEDLDR